MFRLETKNTELDAEESEKAMEQFKPVKGGLKLTEDDGEPSDDEKSINVSYLEDESPSVEEISVYSLNLEPKKVQKGCKSELENIADKFFGQIFSQ